MSKFSFTTYQQELELIVNLLKRDVDGLIHTTDAGGIDTERIMERCDRILAMATEVQSEVYSSIISRLVSGVNASNAAKLEPIIRNIQRWYEANIDGSSTVKSN